MPALAAIFFDIDDTLYSTTEFASRARRRAVSAMVRQGLALPEEVVYRELSEVISEFTSNYPNHFDKLLLRLPRESWEGVNRALLIAAGVMAYHGTKSELAPFPDVKPFLDRLKRGGQVMAGIITHGLEIKQAEKLLLLDIVRYLRPDAIFISDQVGISKPNPKLYLRACEQTGIAPQQAMYVGDNPTHDVDPPNSIGMVSVRLQRENRFAGKKGSSEPRYEIQRMDELVPILARDFGVHLPP